MKHIGDICRSIAKRLEIELCDISSDYTVDKIFDTTEEVVCVISRSGMGKTTFALDIALEKAVNSDKNVVIVSYDKSAELMTAELVMKLCGLNICFINEEKKKKLSQVLSFLGKQNIYLEGFEQVEHPALSDVESLVSGVDNVGLVVVDGLCDLYNGVSVETQTMVRALRGISRKAGAPTLVTTYYARDEIRRMLSGDMTRNLPLDSGIDKLVVLYRTVVETTMSTTADYLVADAHSGYELSTLHYDTKNRRFQRNAD